MLVITILGYVFFAALVILVAARVFLPFEVFGQRAAFMGVKDFINGGLALFALSSATGHLATAWTLVAFLSMGMGLLYLAAYGIMKTRMPNLMKMIEPERPLPLGMIVFYLAQAVLWYMTAGLPVWA